MNPDDILSAIAALSEDDRAALFASLRARYDLPALRPFDGLRAWPKQLALDVTGFDGPADFMIVFDGDSLGNPGAGYGSYAIFEGGQGNKTRLSFGGEMTNNEAEYRSLLTALGALLAQLEKASRAPAEHTLEVRGDSTLVLNQVRGDWKVKEPRLRELRDQVRELLGRFKAHRLVSQPREDTVRVLGH